MKTINLFLPICFLLLCSTAAFADEQSHRKLADEFMKLTDIEKLTTKIFDQLKQSQLQRIAQGEYPGKNDETDKALQGKVQKYMDATLVMKSFSKSFEQVYIDLFSEEELEALVKFYSSPVGKKIQENGLEIRNKILGSIQGQLNDFGLQLMNIERDFLDMQKKNSPAADQTSDKTK